MLVPPPPAPAVHTLSVNAAPVQRHYSFAGGEMGMDFTAWRAASPTAAAAPCTQDGVRQVCALGSPPIGGGYLARDLTFTFVDRKLAAISFKSSIDGFSYATAALKRQCGEPTQIVRDTLKTVDGVSLPHVQMIWRNGRSTVTLNDPLPSSLVVSVRLQLDAAAKALVGSAT